MLLKRAGASSPAARLRRHRPSRAPRAARGRRACGASTRPPSPPAAAVFAYSEHEASVADGLARPPRARIAASSSSRSASTPSASCRRPSRPPRTSSRSAPTRTGTSSCSSGSPAGCPRPRSDRHDRRAQTVAAPGPGERQARDGPPVRGDAEAARRAPGSSRSPCGRTATRARRRSSCRRWRSRSRWSSRRTQAIATGYGLVDGENCRLVAPGDDEGFERALGEVLRDEWHARALGASARATVEREPQLGAVRRPDRADPARRSRSTRDARSPTRVSPAGARCAASSSRAARRPRVGLHEQLADAPPRRRAASPAPSRTPRPRCSPSR